MGTARTRQSESRQMRACHAESFAARDTICGHGPARPTHTRSLGCGGIGPPFPQGHTAEYVVPSGVPTCHEQNRQGGDTYTRGQELDVPARA